MLIFLQNYGILESGKDCKCALNQGKTFVETIFQKPKKEVKLDGKYVDKREEKTKKSFEKGIKLMINNKK